MAKWDHARYIDVIEHSRIDGEYHSHSGKLIEQSLLRSSLTLSRLKDCCEKITSGHTPLRHKLTCGDIFFVTVECVSPLRLNYALTKRVDTKHYSGELNRVALTEDCIVVTIKRRIALASPCYALKGKTVVNQDVAVLKLRQSWCPGYVATYLISKYGQQLADRERTEQMNPYLPVNKLGRILIPQLPVENQKRIEELTKTRFKCLAAIENAYFDAQKLLESELGLDKLCFNKLPGFTAQLIELAESRRFDSEHFYPEFSNFVVNLPAKIKLMSIEKAARISRQLVNDVYKFNKVFHGPVMKCQNSNVIWLRKQLSKNV